MISVDEFRESYINEDINAQAVNTSRYPIEVFIESAVDILQNDYSLNRRDGAVLLRIKQRFEKHANRCCLSRPIG